MADLPTLLAALRERFERNISPHEAYTELLNLSQGDNNILNFSALIEETGAKFREVIPELNNNEGKDKLYMSIFLRKIKLKIEKYTFLSFLKL